MTGMRTFLILGIELVVQIDEIVVEVVVEIIVIVVEVVIIQIIVVEVVFLVVPLLIVLEVFVLRILVRYLLRQPRLRLPPVVQEAPRGLQHGAHYRTLLVVRRKRARASPRVTTSYDRSR